MLERMEGPFVPSESLLREILSPHERLLFVRTRPLRAFFVHWYVVRQAASQGFKVHSYVVMPSLERPVFIVPWSGRASRAFFRNEATAPYNSRRGYFAKWLLASIGVAQLLQRGFVVVCTHD